LVSVSLFIPPRIENITAGLGGVVLFAAVFTPLLFVATRPGGNWIELQQARLRIRRSWISRLDIPYSNVIEVRESCRHNPLASYVLRRGGAPFEEHVDLKINPVGVGWRYQMGGWASLDGAIHVSPQDPVSFVATLRRRIEAQLQ
jgi:hypothetical protein